MNARLLINPQELQSNTKEYALAHFAARTNWHKIYDHLPTIETTLKDKSSDVLREFLKHCDTSNIALDWTRHIHFARWLEHSNHAKLLPNGLDRVEFMAATASAWAHDNFVNLGFSRVIIVDKSTNLAVGAIRPSSINEFVRVVRLSAHESNEPNDTVAQTAKFEYGTSNSWEIKEWIKL